jgi:hypothetical protein
MNDLPRQTLRELITRYGPSLADDPRRCAALLWDLSGSYKREVHALVTALNEGVPADLQRTPGGVPIETRLSTLATRVADNRGLAPDLARWAVDSWAIVLGIPFGGSLAEPSTGPPSVGNMPSPDPIQVEPVSSHVHVTGAVTTGGAETGATTRQQQGGRVPWWAIGLATAVVIGMLAALAVFVGPFRPAGTSTAFAAPAPVSYTGPRRQGKGADVHANRANRAPTIDGSLDDWSGASSWPAASLLLDDAHHPWKDPADLSASFLIGYDDSQFYLGAVITDNTHVQNEMTRDLALYKGDDIELWFDRDLPGDFDNAKANDDDLQMGLSAGDFGRLGPQAVFWLPKPEEGDAVARGVKVVAVRRPDGQGYTLEAAAPWSALHISAPRPGDAIGFCADGSDNDEVGTAKEEHMISTCNNKHWSVPTEFGNLFW